MQRNVAKTEKTLAELDTKLQHEQAKLKEYMADLKVAEQRSGPVSISFQGSFTGCSNACFYKLMRESGMAASHVCHGTVLLCLLRRRQTAYLNAVSS